MEKKIITDVPPNNIDAENAVLGSMLMDEGMDAIKEIWDFGLSTNDFYNTDNSKLFSVLLGMYEQGDAIDQVTATQACIENNIRLLNGKEEYKYIDDLIGATPTSKNALHYARIVKEMSTRRSIIHKSRKMIEIIEITNNPAHDLIEIGSEIDKYILELQELYKGNGDYQSPFKEGKELENREFGNVNWIIPEYLPEGLTLLTGKPKVGKSWLVVNWGLAIASGGYTMGYNVEKGSVLYLALEDNEKRLKNRIKKVLNNGSFPETFYYTIRTERGLKGLGDIEKWIQAHQDCKLIIIDTLRAFRTLTESKNVNLYEKDSCDLDPIQKMALKYSIAIVITHHVSKMKSDDDFDTVSGTLGLTGTADTIMILKKDQTHSDAVLLCRGREYEDGDIEVAMSFDKDLATWAVLGDANEYRLTAERQEIVELLKSHKTLTPKEISDLLNKPNNNVRRLLYKMVSSGDVYQDGYGKYSVR